MKRSFYFLIILTLGLMLDVGSFISFDSAYAQSEINVTAQVPCFLNYTGSPYLGENDTASVTGIEFLRNCDFQGDYLSAVTISFDWVTGGYLPMILVVVLIVFTYIKYQTAIYPLAIGVIWLPFSFWAFPDEFISYGFAIGAVVGAGAVISALIKQTKEY